MADVKLRDMGDIALEMVIVIIAVAIAFTIGDFVVTTLSGSTNTTAGTQIIQAITQPTINLAQLLITFVVAFVAISLVLYLRGATQG